MRRRWFQFDWSIALVLSIAVHAALVQWMLHDQIVALASRLFRGLMPDNAVVATAVGPVDPGQIGEDDGVGSSIAKAPGDTDAASPRDADDQPFLSRDPAGLGHIGDKPSPYTGPTGGALSSAMQRDAATPDPTAAFPQEQQSPATPQPPVRPSPAARAPERPTVAKPMSVAAAATPADPSAAANSEQKVTPQRRVDDKLRLAGVTSVSANPAAPSGDLPTSSATAEQTPDTTATANHPPAPPTAETPKLFAAANPPPTPTESPTPSPPAAAEPSPSPVAPAPADSPAQPQPPQITPPHPQVALAQPTPPMPSAKQAGRPMRSADPAPQADSEIDPFSKNPSVIFRDGKMTVQAGRKAKLTRPQLTLAGFWDGIALGHVECTLHIVVDSTGTVVRADVIKSSGSNEIDNPISLEAYNWWFEPDKDENGKPVATDFPFTVGVFR